MSLSNPPEFGDLLELRIYCTLGDQTSVNVLHYAVLSPVGGNVTMEELAESISDDVAPIYKAMMSTQAQFRGVGLRSILPIPKSVEYFSNEGAGFGSEDSHPLPGQVAGIITKKTGAAGRKFRGRMYLPFPPESLNDADHTPSAGYLGSLNSLGDLLFNTITVTNGANSTDLSPRLMHGPTTGVPATFIEDFTARDKWGTQRRRGAYGRPNVSPI